MVTTETINKIWKYTYNCYKLKICYGQFANIETCFKINITCKFSVYKYNFCIINNWRSLPIEVDVDTLGEEVPKLSLLSCSICSSTVTIFAFWGFCSDGIMMNGLISESCSMVDAKNTFLALSEMRQKHNEYC